jgi:hypothetical protein
VTTMSDHLALEEHGTLVTMRPISDAARDWFLQHVGEPAPGGVYHVEKRFASDIVFGCARVVLNWQ